jgi:PhnB protein
MATLNAYINFDGKTREAMTFYRECLGGELNFMTVAGSPIEEHMPADAKDRIVHSTLTGEGHLLMASDMVGPTGLTQGNNMALMLSCRDEAELRSLFDKLSVGGEADYPPAPAFWGGFFAHFTDRFGVIWAISTSNGDQA